MKRTKAKIRKRPSTENQLVYSKPPFTPQLIDVLNRARITAKNRNDKFVRINDVTAAVATIGSPETEKFLV